MGKIIIKIILVNIEITIIQTIIFEFEDMLYLFSMSLPKKTLELRTFKFRLNKVHKMVKKKMFQSKIIEKNVYPAVLPIL
jgi:hypothetical protein